jgi:hypothetical protein
MGTPACDAPSGPEKEPTVPTTMGDAELLAAWPVAEAAGLLELLELPELLQPTAEAISAAARAQPTSVGTRMTLPLQTTDA